MPRYFVVVDTFAARATPMSLITRLVSFLQPRYERHPVAMPAVLLALWLCLAVGWRSLGMPDEGRYSVIALDMALHNQWLEPLLNGLPFSTSRRCFTGLMAWRSNSLAQAAGRRVLRRC